MTSDFWMFRGVWGFTLKFSLGERRALGVRVPKPCGRGRGRGAGAGRRRAGRPESVPSRLSFELRSWTVNSSVLHPHDPPFLNEQ